MRRQLTAYLSEEEFHRLRDEADERGITLSRYVKERLFQAEGGAGTDLLGRDARRDREANHSGDPHNQRGDSETARAPAHHAARDDRSVCAEHAEPFAGDSRGPAQSGARVGRAASSRLAGRGRRDPEADG